MNSYTSSPAFRSSALPRRILTALLLIVAAMLCPVNSRAAEQPAATPGPVLKGTITAHVFDQSRIFPGTTRNYWVYVPKQYDPAKPACVYIGQDGLNPKFTDAFDQLIASRQMPVTVGIFITPGAVRPPAANQAPRINRSFEYNSLGDDYARFLLEELLPTIVKEQKLNLSNDPNDRCIGGASSGGSAAFTTAWERPDAFRRVYSSSGAFPYTRDNCYSVLIRKCETKPLRLYLIFGKNDMYNAGGDLWMDNEKLNNSFVFAGYDFKYVCTEGGHCDKYVDAFPEAMTWLWRDWPAPVVSGSNPPRVADIVLPNEPWRLVGEGYQAIRSITVNPKGEVFFADTPANKVFKVGADGKAEVFLSDAKQVCGLTTGPDGKLYGVSEITGNVFAFEQDQMPKAIAQNIPGHGIVATRDGSLYVAVPGPAGTAESKVWHISAKGEKKIVDTGLQGATGAAISCDGWLLQVGDGRSHWVYSYQINADGSLTNREHYYWLHTPDWANDSGVDGVATDSRSVLYAATRMGIQTSDSQGHNQCLFPLPGGPVTAIAFGGPNFDILYASCGGKLYARKVKVQGIHAFQPPVKPGNIGL